MNTNGRLKASQVMDEAIELAIEERSPYPERAFFVDADAPGAGRRIARAAEDGYSVVLVSSDGSKLILHPEQVAPVSAPTA